MENKIIDLTALTEYDTKIKELINNQALQYDTMPEASEDNLGQIIQYTGVAGNYTPGYFYKCVSDGQQEPTYSWENIQIQDEELGYIPNSITVNSTDLENPETIKEVGNFITENAGKTVFIYFNIYNSAHVTQICKYYIDATKTFYSPSGLPRPVGISIQGLRIKGSWNNNKFTVSELESTYCGADYEFLNTGSDARQYTPTLNYHPATKKYVDDAIAAIDITDREVVQELPTQDISTKTIYMVPKTTAGTQNAYTEYMYINNAWEKIGDTEIDLTNYVTSSDLSTAIAGVETQYSTMPTASATNLGEIAQYTGTTDSTYTNGYFYQVVSDGEATPTYSWANIQVQQSNEFDFNDSIFFINLRRLASAGGNDTEYRDYVYSTLSKLINDHTNQPDLTTTTINTSFLIGVGDSTNPYHDTRSDYRASIFSISVIEPDVRAIRIAPSIFAADGRKLNINITWNNHIATVTGISLQSGNDDKFVALSIANNNTYTPTVGSYNPATAKYAESMLEAIAPVYDPISTYAEGDKVSYQGKIYSCTTAIDPAEAWTPAHWTQTTVNNMVNDIDVSGKEDKTNKVTSISAQSTDAQYPSAKCVYDLVGDIASVLATLTTVDEEEY